MWPSWDSFCLSYFRHSSSNVRITTPGFLSSFVSRSVVVLIFLILPLWAAARDAAAGMYGNPFPMLIYIIKIQHECSLLNYSPVIKSWVFSVGSSSIQEKMWKPFLKCCVGPNHSPQLLKSCQSHHPCLRNTSLNITPNLGLNALTGVTGGHAQIILVRLTLFANNALLHFLNRDAISLLLHYESYFVPRAPKLH